MSIPRHNNPYAKKENDIVHLVRPGSQGGDKEPFNLDKYFHFLVLRLVKSRIMNEHWKHASSSRNTPHFHFSSNLTSVLQIHPTDRHSGNLINFANSFIALKCHSTRPFNEDNKRNKTLLVNSGVTLPIWNCANIPQWRGWIISHLT